MNNIKLFLMLPFLIVGCGEKEKNADYYYNHPEELGAIYNDCEAKIKATEPAGSAGIDALFEDKQCNMIFLAKAGIDLGSMKKARANEAADNKTYWAYFLTKVKSRRMRLEFIEEDFNRDFSGKTSEQSQKKTSQ